MSAPFDFDSRSREFDQRMKATRRAVRVFQIVTAALAIAVLIFVGWLLLHPEAIGHFLGAVASGFEQSKAPTP